MPPPCETFPLSLRQAEARADWPETAFEEIWRANARRRKVRDQKGTWAEFGCSHGRRYQRIFSRRLSEPVFESPRLMHLGKPMFPKLRAQPLVRGLAADKKFCPLVVIGEEHRAGIVVGVGR